MDYDQMKNIFNRFKPNIVYHLAAQSRASFSEEHPYDDLDINAKGTINIIRCVAESDDVNVMVLASSQACEEPWSNYAVSKIAAEEYVKKYSREGLIQGKIARFSSVYGSDRYTAGEDEPIWHGAVNRFLYQAMYDQPLTVHGLGAAKRDFIDVRDVVIGLEYVRVDGQIGGTYNVGTGVQHTVKDVARMAQFITKSDSEIRYVDAPTEDFKEGPFDVAETFKLGFVPKYDLYLGMRDTYRDMKKIMKDFVKEEESGNESS